ncbi:ArsR/SmtB family transcription factor [Flexivirga oryzae]|uniref:DNA-binding transcriptional ArsR family regulator n=1 Tax=Flexivirga oryzae TaxID=1794944 RepID=A0A839N401_9MICO|nr:DNA-binding transcriptional ArsR family regulator [Flexivirga oryzae]
MAMNTKEFAATHAAGDEVEALMAAACMFKSLGDPTRLAIVQHLALGEHRVVDMTAHLGLAQSTVSAHLACLKDCDLVASRPVGRASMFSLKHPELLDLLRQAEVLLGVTRDAVALCPTYGSAAAGPR